jgi:hypothetical protein
LTAFAGCFLAAFDVHDLDLAAGVLHKACRLKRAGVNGNAGPPHSEHFGEEFLREI